jgi:Kef-type K+ transport system membrane component KefB/Trk K+ transport system NAD-binding subunit
MEHLIFEIGLVIIAASAVGVVLYFLKQPLILAYILAGILLGPFGFGLIHDTEFIHGIATVGIMLMLFLVGLEMNVARLKDLGLVSLVAGAGQVVFTGLIGFLLVSLFGFTLIQSLYIAVALTFSSTVIAVKIMSDKKDTKSLYGQICIGILIVQDVLAIIALLILAGFKEGSFSFDVIHFGEVLVKGAVLGVAAALVSKYILKHLYKKIATSQELLILFSLSWCFLISLLSMEIGFSMEIGAFIAGISLANFPYTYEINSKAKTLQDFFITIFFVALGSGLMFSSIVEFLVPLVVLSLFVLVGNPLIVLAIMGIMGYDKRTSFFTGLAIANISEFSLIVIAMGSSLGHLDEQISSMVAVIGITTMVISSYMMSYNNQLFAVLKKFLVLFERKNKKEMAPKKSTFANHIILFGCGSVGEQILEKILSFKDDYLVVDHNNQVMKHLIENNIPCVFGDVEDEDLLQELDIEDSELIISTLPNIEDNYILLKYLKGMHSSKRPIVIVTADSAREGLDLFNRGADYIVLKPYLAAHHVHIINKELYQIEEEMEQEEVLSQKVKHQKCPKSNNIIHDYHEDAHIAKIIHGLNTMRIQEIKERIRKEGGKFLRKEG